MQKASARRDHHALDNKVRASLKTWPQHPPGATSVSRGTWLRGRPGEDINGGQPYLKFPGSARMRTLPDGLWLHFSPDPADAFVDILCIEACSTFQNLLDKRSRFAPSTCSLLAYCPVPWMLAPAQPGDPTPRWRLVGLLRAEPVEPLVLPVRDVRVLYGLIAEQYDGFARNQVPQAHEYFCPMDALTADRGHESPAMQALIARASATANFMHLPDGPDAPPRPILAAPETRRYRPRAAA
jgi:hypothetical protein